MREVSWESRSKKYALGLLVGLQLIWGNSDYLAARPLQEVDANQAMRSVGSQSWYEKSTDSFAIPDPGEVSDNKIRSEGWAYKPKATRATGNTAPATRPAGGGWTGVNADAITGFIMVLIIVLVIGAFAALAYFALRNYIPAPKQAVVPKKFEVDVAKVEDLPFEVSKPTHGNPLDEAEALMRAGRLREAIIYLYGYQLLALDQARKIDLQRGKTNRMYVRELQKYTRLKDILTTTMLIFEDAYFGQHEIGMEQFKTAWNLVDEFHHLAARNEPQAPPSRSATGRLAQA
ncbi:MAG: hypothetical protein VXZ82_13940 [Planctomycetota bacterium]|nr:hypothetical protein [Planctomycetota bacterium]